MLSSRRTFLSSAALGLTVSAVPAAGVQPFDELMTAFVAENKVPGAALAVARRGRLVYARGFGYADVAKKRPVRPTSLFRIASVSKPITAVAVLQLVERKRLGLDDKVLDRLKPQAAPADARWKRITVRHCLHHTGGWDRDQSFDPINRPHEIAKTLGTPLPVTPEHVVRYMLGKRLDFAPGRRFAYSNLGYLVLGRVLEAVTGRRYEEYVRTEVLAPLGVTKMSLGRALPEDRPTDEVRYYSNLGSGPCLYPPREGKTVPVVDGAMNLEGFEAHGGWIASAVDLVRFASAFDEPDRCPILKAATIDAMLARPAGTGSPFDDYYACGWQVVPMGCTTDANVWHNGSIPGSESLLVRRHDGLTWAVLFNTNDAPNGDSLVGRVDARVHAAADAVAAWPAGTPLVGPL